MIKRNSSRGFTLIELMIVLAVIAILAAIAIPAYRDSILKGRRAQARTAILGLLQEQERYMTQYNTYLKFSNSAGTTNPSPVPFTTYAGDSQSGTPYWLSADVCGTQLINQCVKVTATPTFGDDSAVGSLSMTSSGTKTCSGTAQTSNPQLCWP